ncbi:transmembrane protein 70, mitochondrial [Silurus meridionalis]|nr:transmembrane protein 70, mitochondrial [Silurus meridionalis]
MPSDLDQRANVQFCMKLRKSATETFDMTDVYIRPSVYGRWYSSQPSSTEDGNLIYTGNLGRAVLGVKFFSYSSSVFSLCVMPLVLMKTGIGVSSLAMKVAFCGFIGFFTFLTPVLLHLITKGYVVRLYHNQETDMYTVVTYSALLVEKKTVFHQSDVKVPDVSRMFTSFYAKNKSLLINPEMFHIPHDYNHLMGYDRPFSFDPDDINKPEN